MTEAKTRADFEVGWCQREMRTAQPLGFFRVLGLELGDDFVDASAGDVGNRPVGQRFKLEVRDRHVSAIK
jgi:hypothetical protein